MLIFFNISTRGNITLKGWEGEGGQVENRSIRLNNEDN